MVTNFRLFIVQGYEVCKTWRVADLPPHLVRFARRPGGEESRTVDVDALQSMLGGAFDQYAESKAIRAFGKQLDQIKRREDGRP